MSDTPRTDARAYDFTNGQSYVDGVVTSDFARELERENAALVEDKARLDSGMIRLRAFSEWGNEWCIHSGIDLRAAIDTARAKEAKL